MVIAAPLKPMQMPQRVPVDNDSAGFYDDEGVLKDYIKELDMWNFPEFLMF